MRTGPALVFLLLLGASGCRSEAEERADLARTLARDCVDGMAESLAEQKVTLPKGVDSDRICACAIKKSVSDGNIKALRKLASDGPGTAELDMRGACIVEEARRAKLVTP